jgi:hypothetical protein
MDDCAVRLQGQKRTFAYDRRMNWSQSKQPPKPDVERLAPAIKKLLLGGLVPVDVNIKVSVF